MHKYAKFDQNIPCASKVMSIFAKNSSSGLEAKPRHQLAYQWLENVKINKMQNLIEIYHLVQEL